MNSHGSGIVSTTFGTVVSTRIRVKDNFPLLPTPLSLEVPLRRRGGVLGPKKDLAYFFGSCYSTFPFSLREWGRSKGKITPPSSKVKDTNDFKLQNSLSFPSLVNPLKVQPPSHHSGDTQGY